MARAKVDGSAGLLPSSACRTLIIGRPRSRPGKQKIMIYMTREIINGREAKNAQIPGPRAKTPTWVINEYESKQPPNGRQSGIVCPVLAASRRPRAALNVD